MPSFFSQLPTGYCRPCKKNIMKETEVLHRGNRINRELTRSAHGEHEHHLRVHGTLRDFYCETHRGSVDHGHTQRHPDADCVLSHRDMKALIKNRVDVQSNEEEASVYHCKDCKIDVVTTHQTDVHPELAHPMRPLTRQEILDPNTPNNATHFCTEHNAFVSQDHNGTASHPMRMLTRSEMLNAVEKMTEEQLNRVGITRNVTTNATLKDGNVTADIINRKYKMPARPHKDITHDKGAGTITETRRKRTLSLGPLSTSVGKAVKRDTRQVEGRNFKKQNTTRPIDISLDLNVGGAFQALSNTVGGVDKLLSLSSNYQTIRDGVLDALGNKFEIDDLGKLGSIGKLSLSTTHAHEPWSIGTFTDTETSFKASDDLMKKLNIAQFRSSHARTRATNALEAHILSIDGMDDQEYNIFFAENPLPENPTEALMGAFNQLLLNCESINTTREREQANQASLNLMALFYFSNEILAPIEGNESSEKFIDSFNQYRQNRGRNTRDDNEKMINSMDALNFGNIPSLELKATKKLPNGEQSLSITLGQNTNLERSTRRIALANNPNANGLDLKTTMKFTFTPDILGDTDLVEEARKHPIDFVRFILENTPNEFFVRGLATQIGSIFAPMLLEGITTQVSRLLDPTGANVDNDSDSGSDSSTASNATTLSEAITRVRMAANVPQNAPQPSEAQRLFAVTQDSELNWSNHRQDYYVNIADRDGNVEKRYPSSTPLAEYRQRVRIHRNNRDDAREPTDEEIVIAQIVGSRHLDWSHTNKQYYPLDRNGNRID